MIFTQRYIQEGAVMTFVIDPKMDQLDHDILNELVAEHTGPALTIYMPTEVKGAETQQNRIRLKNLFAEATTALSPLLERKAQVEAFLAPLEALMADEYFWQHQSEGLAIFLAPDFFQYYRLPVRFDELVIAQDRFHIKPLLPLLTVDGRFYLLALRQGGVTLYQGSRFSLSEVTLGDEVPTSLQEVLQYDEFEESLQFRNTGTGRYGGDQAGMFHGQGLGGDDSHNREQIQRFFQQLDNGVCDLLKGKQHPLVLAGVSFLEGIYRQVNKYHALTEESIQQDPETLEQASLHQAAWAIVEPLIQAERDTALADLHSILGNQDERASQQLEQIVPAAYFQRVDTFFMAADSPVWGTFDPEKNQARLLQERQPQAVDLIDLAAVHTLLNGGAVYQVDAAALPAATPAAAIYRY